MNVQTEVQPWQEMLTTEQRKFLMDELDYEESTGLFRWKRDGRGQTKRRGVVAGSSHSNGYIRIKLRGKTFLAHRLAWLFVYGEWPADEVDHINRKKTDNRICNLRAATVAQNRRNTKGQPSRRIKSRFKGVSPEHRSRKWVAKLCVDGRHMVIGRFVTEEDAAIAYQEAAIKYHGEFAAW